MNKYQDVFNDLGHIGNAKIVIDPSVLLVQHSPRRIPVALLEDVKKKITELERKALLLKQSSPQHGSAVWK